MSVHNLWSAVSKTCTNLKKKALKFDKMLRIDRQRSNSPSLIVIAEIISWFRSYKKLHAKLEKFLSQKRFKKVENTIDHYFKFDQMLSIDK